MEYEERVNICKASPLYKDLYGGQCNPNLWLNPETNEVSNRYKDGFIKGCGCRILSKARNGHCTVGKW